jgi:hypothetical protein
MNTAAINAIAIDGAPPAALFTVPSHTVFRSTGTLVRPDGVTPAVDPGRSCGTRVGIDPQRSCGTAR